VSAVPRKRAAQLALGALVLLALAVLAWRLDLLGLTGGAALRRALTQRGRVAIAGPSGWPGLQPEGTQWADVPALPELATALRGSDPAPVYAAIERDGLDGLLVQTGAGAGDEQPGSVRARLARYEHVQGLRGVYLAPTAALYALDPVAQLPQAHREATAVVARALVGGARPPKSSSFPESLRRLRPVEVMVLLRHGERARLWRSSRGSSIASALVTAAVVARQRWQEREQAMGGPLDKLLPRMEVEVALIEDDGTIGSSDPAFIDRVFGKEHGVAYERKGAWRYLLPDATQTYGKGSASRAYRKLFSDDGLPQDSFDRSELRLYRLLVRQLAVSPAEPPPRDGVSEVHSPDEVLDARPPP
jgi:hypothetical protein